jgi:hypothetical protein
VCLERKNRIRLSLAAYSYEFKADSIMSDGEFDELAKKINPKMLTGNEMLDTFFKEHFSPDTGQWIHSHPEINKIAAIYLMYKNPNKKLVRFGAKVYEYK